VTLSRRQVRDLLHAHGLAPSRALGQNFVVDPNTVRRIATLAGVGPGDRVVEIGAGLGSLTLALAERGAEVTAVEIDRRLVPLLREVVEPAGVRVVQADARTVDWDRLLGGPEDDGADWALVANLPYNIATPLVLDILERVPVIGRLLVMVQREVAERLAAGVGHAAYGIPSVKVSWWADAVLVGRVPPTVFVPQPRVESALVRLVRHRRWADQGVDRPTVFRLIDVGFGQRRKMLRRSLAGLVERHDLERAGIRPEARAEQLTLEDWVRLGATVAGTMPM
jgi:16S rRNA (adenine1518-N6/adenine1519-N6)-dimethyltransferase